MKTKKQKQTTTQNFTNSIREGKNQRKKEKRRDMYTQLSISTALPTGP